METQTQLTDSKASRWVWLLFFGAISVYFFASFAANRSPHYALSAFGFLCLGLNAYKNPVSFSGPLWPQVKGPHKTARGFELLGLIGAALAFIGAVWRWYTP
ncbi:hypothetical protein [Luteimonas chenhongjianii]|uniref:hypothetical protein n=1 Tax=Luteimonas chenhongjianii TaxID=2006110 RepID=UPI0012FE2480|nr:hypothetical protein [Luteimonas chenhongjianii]